MNFDIMALYKSIAEFSKQKELLLIEKAELERQKREWCILKERKEPIWYCDICFEDACVCNKKR